jgi:predicted TIM-barrel fold metal-dependent hydrolase
MIDGYTHLDMSTAYPIADLARRMKSAAIGRALLVETWSGDNRRCLQQLMVQPAEEFRIAPCFRPEQAEEGAELLTLEVVRALRVKTADLHRLGPTATALQSTRKWLPPHAESGIAALTDNLLQLAGAYPELLIYLPHMGWPRRAKLDDDDWGDSIAALSKYPNLIVGVSAIAHFSRDAFPHHDVAHFASHLFETFGPEALVAASDYPLIDKDKYSQYMQLTSGWIGGVEQTGHHLE